METNRFLVQSFTCWFKPEFFGTALVRYEEKVPSSGSFGMARIECKKIKKDKDGRCVYETPYGIRFVYNLWELSPHTGQFLGFKMVR